MSNPTPTAPDRRKSGWHRTDLLSLFFGIVFLAVVGWWAVSYYLDWSIDWNLPNFGWFVAGALILLGLLGLLASARRSSDRTSALPPPAPAPPTAVPFVERPSTEVPMTVRTDEPAAPADRFVSSPEEPTAADPGTDRRE